MELYLIRHGHINRDGTSDDYYYRLSDIGNKEAQQVSLFINDNVFDQNKSNLLISSNTLRTIETSMYISEIIKTKIDIVDNIHEIDLGFNESKPKNEWLYTDEKGNFTNRENMTYEEKFVTRHYLGESPYDVYLRIMDLEKIIRSSNNDCVYVVGHGTTLRLLTMMLLQENEKWYYDEKLPNNGSVRKLVLDKKVSDYSYIWR